MSDDEINILDNTCQTTRSIIPDSFDWETVDLMPTPSCQTPITLPWDGQGSLATIYGNDKLYDFKKNDGRVLLQSSFTTEGNSPLINPYFILYNKYNGLLRVYLYMTTQFISTSSALEGSISVNDPYLSILNFLESGVINAESHKQTFSEFLPGQIDGTRPLASNKWYMMQYEMAYDPSISQKENLTMNLNIGYYDIQSFKFSGDAQGSINGTIGGTASSAIKSELIKSGKAVSTAFLSGVGVDFVNHHSLSTNDTVNNDLGINNKIFELISTGVSNALKSSVQGLPSVAIDLLSGIIFGKGATTQSVNLNFAVDKINLEGSGSNSGSLPSMPLTIKIPGMKNIDTAQGIIPNYREPLGVFNFTAKPSMAITIRNWQRDRFDDPMQPGQRITESGASYSVPQHEYDGYVTINPALLQIADVNVDCKLVADYGGGDLRIEPMGDSVYNSGEFGAPEETLERPQFYVKCVATVKPKNGDVKYYIHKCFAIDVVWNDRYEYLDPIY